MLSTPSRLTTRQPGTARRSPSTSGPSSVGSPPLQGTHLSPASSDIAPRPHPGTILYLHPGSYMSDPLPCLRARLGLRNRRTRPATWPDLSLRRRGSYLPWLPESAKRLAQFVKVPLLTAPSSQ